MADYIAGRPCVFGGDKYLIGDLIPFEAVEPRREKALIDSGHIYKAPAVNSGEALELIRDSATELKIDITISKAGDGTKTAVFLTPEEIKLVFQAWIENVENANRIIVGIDNLDVLEAIKAKETRKGVLEAIEKRAGEFPDPANGETHNTDTETAKEGGEVGEA